MALEILYERWVENKMEYTTFIEIEWKMPRNSIQKQISENNRLLNLYFQSQMLSEPRLNKFQNFSLFLIIRS